MATENNIINPLLQENFDNLSQFLDRLNCLNEIFDYNELMLNVHQRTVQAAWDKFIEENGGPDESGKIVVPEAKQRAFKTIERKLNRSKQAHVLIPPSYLVSLVSLFDTFYAGLVRNIYNLCPKKLQNSDMQFCYRDLQPLDSIKEVKRIIVDKKIEDLLRGSHTDQFKWLADALGVKTLTKFEDWPKFIELTERRNLFVHSNGIVSTQYNTICKKNQAFDADIPIGTQLKIDSSYFSDACDILAKTAVMLSQMLARTLYLKQYPDEDSQIDKNLICTVFDFIMEKKYSVAISVSNFALNDKFKHNDNDKYFIILNLAQALKWNCQKKECLTLLSVQDCTAWKTELLIPKYALEEKFEEAYEKMIELGHNNKVLTASAYREWPIFQQIRKEDKFAQTFQSIFGEELGAQQEIKIEDKEIEQSLSIVLG